ncbi:MAG: FkbM family methyltransferase, partial [Ferruginibacter sp.]|nr:FkbM family methyltransferase [Ferruginibacter sp.]
HLKNYFFTKHGLPKIANEKISKVLLRKYLPTNPVIIDCGAHDGSDSIELAKLFRKACIHSFEPVRNLHERLARNVKEFPNIHIHRIALSDENGIRRFYISEGQSDASSSLLPPASHLIDHPSTLFSAEVMVNTLTLDTWAQTHGITQIDMLWLDMQGFEMKMLQASQTILSTVSVIHTEVSTRETYRGVALYPELRAFLEALGFVVKLEAIPLGWDMGNVLFIKKQ